MARPSSDTEENGGVAHTLTVLTLWLAQAIGLYACGVGVLLVAQPARLGAIVGDVEASPALALLAGVAAFAVGVAILVPHHVTHDGLALTVTALALVAAIEGLFLIAFPQVPLRLARVCIPIARPLGVVALIFGLILFLAGLTGRADALP